MKDQFLAFAEKYGLKEKALSGVDIALDACIESDKEYGEDVLEGNDRSDLIYAFGRYELRCNQHNNWVFATRINIYSKKLFGPSIDIPVGYYEELTLLDGHHSDEFLIFDWSVMRAAE